MRTSGREKRPFVVSKSLRPESLLPFEVAHGHRRSIGLVPASAVATAEFSEWVEREASSVIREHWTRLFGAVEPLPEEFAEDAREELLNGGARGVSGWVIFWKLDPREAIAIVLDRYGLRERAELARRDMDGTPELWSHRGVFGPEEQIRPLAAGRLPSFAPRPVRARPREHRSQRTRRTNGARSPPRSSSDGDDDPDIEDAGENPA